MTSSIASGKPREDRAAGQDATPARPQGEGLRARLRARRAAMAPDARARADARIVALLQARIHEGLARSAWGGEPVVLSAFWPIGGEPDLRPALHGWAVDPRLQLALPVVEAIAAPLVFRAWTPDTAMAPGAYRIPEPQGTPVRVPRIVLVPTLGFTAEGDRIGYGGGYYDRTLASLRAAGPVLALGVAYACSRLQAGEHAPEPHDIRLDDIITEEGLPLRAA